ncbi:MAG TPA: hypothetical protein VK177_13590 [Flavobacteriales bacterium]|nr:hypothetical protein [Flavobacteriales bacterium]
MLIYESPKTIQKARENVKKRFLKFFKKGFREQKFHDWERDYKWDAHKLWVEKLNQEEFDRLLNQHAFMEIAKRATAIESKTNLLFSFEKMALRDAVKSLEGAEIFAFGLYDRIYGESSDEKKFENFTRVLAALPRKQTRVVNWPMQTVFPFIANPKKDMFLKPVITKKATEKYLFNFNYQSKPNWNTYKRYLDFGKQIKSDIKDLKPRDMIDIQSYIWVMGDDRYETYG